jgi:dienelactone hydrolase
MHFQIDGLKLPIHFDFYPSQDKNQPLLVFCHGFKGFKDWGTFPLFAQYLANNNINCITVNFSHNGTSFENPQDFVNLEAFSNNTFSLELDDLQRVINWIQNNNLNHWDETKIGLMGHSRAGGIVIRAALENPFIYKVITLAAVSNYENWLLPYHADFEKNGYVVFYNSRTKQDMKVNKILLDDFNQNKDRFSTLKNISLLKQEILIIHGKNDSSVPFSQAQELYSHALHAKILSYETDHVFGGKHPYHLQNLPDVSVQMLDEVCHFLQD